VYACTLGHQHKSPIYQRLVGPHSIEYCDQVHKCGCLNMCIYTPYKFGRMPVTESVEGGLGQTYEARCSTNLEGKKALPP
jgi:hypothetical protein